MKINKLIFIPLVLVVVSLAGCSSGSEKIVKLNLNYVTASSVPIQSTDRNAQAQLAESSTSVSSSLQELSNMQEALHPHAKLPEQMSPRMLGMTQPAQLNWNGPVLPVLKHIAAASGYKLQVLGKTPSIPVIVSINTPSQVPLSTILNMVIWQARTGAVIKAYPSTRTIVLAYKNLG